MKSKKAFPRLGFLLSGLLLFSMFIAACQAGATPTAETGGAAQPTEPQLEGEEQPAATEEPVTLTVWHFLALDADNPRSNAAAMAVQGFEEENPNIHINWEVIPWAEMQAQFIGAYQAGAAPDIIWLWYGDTPLVIDEGMLLDVAPYIAQWPQSEKDDFFDKGLWQVGVVGDAKYSMSSYQNIYFLFYRKDLLDDAGLTPAGMSSWDGFIEGLTALTVDEAGKHPDEAGFDADSVSTWGFGDARSLEQPGFRQLFETLLQSVGGQFVDEDMNPTFNSAAGVAVMKALTDLVQTYHVQPVDSVSYNFEDVSQQFLSGLYAMTYNVSSRFTGWRDSATFGGENLALMSLPSLPGGDQPAIALGSWTINICSQTEHPDEAWSFVEYWTSRQGDMLQGTVAGQMPTRASTFDDPYFDEPEAAWILDVYNLLSETGSTLGQYSTLATGDDELLLAFHQIVLEGRDIQEALDEAAASYEAKIEELGG